MWTLQRLSFAWDEFLLFPDACSDFNTLLTALDILFCQTDAKLCHDVVLWSAETTKQSRFGGILLFNSMLQKAKGKELN